MITTKSVGNPKRKAVFTIAIVGEKEEEQQEEQEEEENEEEKVEGTWVPISEEKDLPSKTRESFALFGAIYQSLNGKKEGEE